MIRSHLVGLRRVLTPSIAATIYYLWKYGAKVSPRAEVEISRNLVFGKKCVVGSFTKIKATYGLLKMGDRGGIASGCFISSREGAIIIGDNFICGPNVSIIASNYVHSDKDRHMDDQGRVSKGIRFGDNVWIGAGCTVTDGAVIGHNTIVVPNSLVNRKYPDNAILQGAPAKVVARR